MNELSIRVGEADKIGKRSVTLTMGKFFDRDKFDVESGTERKRYREKVVPKLVRRFDQIARERGIPTTPGGSDGEAIAHREIEQLLVNALEAAEDGQQSLWTPRTENLADIQPLKAEWFWQGYIPAGCITIIEGDPGKGKSQLVASISARCSRGEAMPGYEFSNALPAGVLLTNLEDDPARVIRPRLEAAGADLGRIHLLREMDGFEGEEQRLISLPSDLPAIEQFILEQKVKLWSIDPFVGVLDAKLSMNSDADVRRCLSQVSAMAERTGVAVVLVRHLNKKSGSHAVYRGGGSIGIAGAARSVLLVGDDPGDGDTRILASVKSNLCEAPPSLRFYIESVGDTSRVAWGDACDVHASDMLKQEGTPGGGSKKQQAEQIITGILTNGPRGESEVLGEIEAAGISPATYWRARRSLGVVSEKIGFTDGWMLSLPSTNGVFHDEF